MICSNDCPARGHTAGNKTLCFCAGKPTIKIKPNAECQYEINNYSEYLKTLPQEESRCNADYEEVNHIREIIARHKCEKKRFDLDRLPHFEAMGGYAYYKKYDDYDAINVDKVAEIPIDYSGVMGVPITILDKEEIMAHVDMLGYARPRIGSRIVYKRILIRWVLEEQVKALYTGKPILSNGLYHFRRKYEEMVGIKSIIKGKSE